MPWPDESVVKRVLSSRGRSAILRSAVAESWVTTVKEYPQRAWWRRKGTHASVMWEHSVQNAITALSEDDGCKPVPHDDTLSFVFDQLVLVRFKKADIELKSRNYPTFLASLFHAHEEELPGFEDLHRVEAAYVLNPLQTNIEWIGIVARHKKQVLWQFDLNPASNVVQLPLPERTQTAAEKVMRAKPDRSIDQENESQK